jgi:hypothetical protein
MTSVIKNIIIRINNESVWFNDHTFVALTNTNLPIADFRFVEGRTIFFSWSDEKTVIKIPNGSIIPAFDFVKHILPGTLTQGI